MILTFIPETKDTIWGLLPESEGWNIWFAWYPIHACGRWRWLTRVQRRRIHPIKDDDWSYVDGDSFWEYRAGYAHDYSDGTLGTPEHFCVHQCAHCGAQFQI